MSVQIGSGAGREFLVVLAIASSGLLLALIAAFAPWYGTVTAPRPARLVELHAPTEGPAGDSDARRAAS